MKWKLSHHFLLVILLAFYRFAFSSSGKSLFGIKSEVYLGLFCIVSFVFFLAECVAFWRGKVYKSLYVESISEIPFVILIYLVITAYCTYVYLSGRNLIFIIISILYLVQAIFLLVVLFKSRKPGNNAGDVSD